MKKQWNVNSILAMGAIPANTEEGRSALTQVYNTWHEGEINHTWPRAIQAFDNVAFLLGNHVARFMYDTTSGFGVSIAAATGLGYAGHGMGGLDDVPKVVDNRLARACESMVGLLTETDPAPRCEPNSDSVEDEDAAALGEITLSLYHERPLDMPTKARDAAMMGAIYEFVAAETEYADTGEVIEVPEVEIQELPNAMTGKVEATPVQTGTRLEARRDERVRMWTSLHIKPDPAATCPEDATWFARTTFEDVDWIRQNYEQGPGRTAKDGFLLEKDGAIPVCAGSNHPLYWFTRVQDLLVTPQETYGSGFSSSLLKAGGALPNQTTFVVIDVRPSPEHPAGRTLIFAGGKLIYANQARAWSEKYPWRWHPYSFWSWFRVPGRFGGMALLSELVPLQKRINAIDYLLQKNREYIAIGQWFIGKHSKVKAGSIGGLPGAHYEFNAIQGLPDPYRVENQALPADVYAEREQLAASIEYIASTGALSDEIAQSAARAGVVLDFLRAEKLRNKSPMLRGFEKFLESIYQNVLIDLQLHLTEEDPVLTERIRLAARDYSALSIQSFTGASLRDHHSVKLDIAASVRHSPEAKSQKAMEYLQYKQGELSPAENAAVLKATGLNEFVKNESDASIQRARRMVARIESGMIEAFLPMQGIDDPFVMAPEFQRAILADRFLTADEAVQKKLLQGFDYYRSLADQMAAAQIAQTMAAEGTMAPPGAAAPAGLQAGPPPEEAPTAG